jgi:hypothetical protein
MVLIPKLFGLPLHIGKYVIVVVKDECNTCVAMTCVCVVFLLNKHIFEIHLIR